MKRPFVERPKSVPRAGIALLAATTTVLAGCATAPAPGGAGPAAQAAPGVDRGGVYAEAVAAARQAASYGRLREALWRWRIAEAVAPDGVASGEAAAAQARLEAAAAAAEAQGSRAALSGRAAEAQGAYMRALDFDPNRPQARSFMRDVLAAQVMADVARTAGSAPKGREGAARKGRRPSTPRRSRPSRP